MTRYRPGKTLVFTLVLFSLRACDDKGPPASPEPPSAPSAKPSQSKAAPETPPAGEEPAAMPALRPPENPSQACAQVIVVAWQGAEHAGPSIKRDKAAALALAGQLIEQAKKQPDFAALARKHSDAPGSGKRGGHIGTHTRDSWPPVYRLIRDQVFGMQVNQIASRPVEAPFGHVIVRRCPVERGRARHILLRYRGARSGGDNAVHTREQALALAGQILKQARKPGADFAALAREHSQDRSAARGGDIGARARGELAPEFEEALFAMTPGQISGPVETEFGFHLVQRVE
jgi:peptidyl-prolyl cis-trans isomerase SurA